MNWFVMRDTVPKPQERFQLTLNSTSLSSSWKWAIVSR